MKNLIQVFGLPRSGTNFMEWTIVNNFKNIRYKNLYAEGNVENFYTYGSKESIKHNYPSLNYSKYAIVIYKKFEIWKQSMIKYNKDQFAKKSVYNKYLKKAEELDENFVLIYDHQHVMNDYFDVLNEISNKFNIEKIDDPQKPKYRLDKGGANARQTSELYNE